MNHLSRIITAGLSALSALMAAAAVDNPQSIKDLLDRIGGAGTSAKIETTVDDGYKSASGAEMFAISTKNGKPWVKGTTLSAVTTGLGWYLNHTANVNLSWNYPSTTLTSLPLPQETEEHTT
ncbi:MAG: alpha-N-acetylglucosaminidase N-terminal domain-containing protein, partial [Muribaculaceae bacterium]|nr:alpha-N-acetylglucosaminidase N-terminal domain-containing protein [Muribaculaceae bacterium]